MAGQELPKTFRIIFQHTLSRQYPKFTIDELVADPEKLRQAGHQVKLEIRAEAMVQVNALLAAGWMFELPIQDDSEPFQWYWRSPPKGKRLIGRKYLSTQQAFNALMKSAITSSPISASPD